MGGLYFGAVAAAMVVGMRYLQASSNAVHREIWLHIVGTTAIAVFFGLIIAGLIIGPRWSPIAAMAFGAMAEALLEGYGTRSRQYLRAGGAGGNITVLAAHRRCQARRYTHQDPRQDTSPPTAA